MTEDKKQIEPYWIDRHPKLDWLVQYAGMFIVYYIIFPIDDAQAFVRDKLENWLENRKKKY